MTADLFFMPTLPQKPPSSFQCDKPGSNSSDPSSKTEPPGLSKGDKHENFLTTLKKVSRDRNPAEGSRRPSPNSSTRSEKAEERRQTKEKDDVDPSAVDDLLSALISHLQNDETTLGDQTPISAEVKELINLLEALGLVAPAGETTLPAGGGAGDQNLSDPSGNIQSGLLSLKQLIEQIQTNDRIPSNDMSTGWERLRLLISNALEGDTSTRNQESSQSVSGASTGEGFAGEKTSDILSALTRTAAETENIPKETGNLKAAENPQTQPRSDNLEKTDGAKLHPDSRTVANQTGDLAKENKFTDKAGLDAPRVDDDPDVQGKTEASNSNAKLSRLSSAAGSGQRVAGEPAQDNPPAAETSSVSKLINDAQADKENSLKANTAFNDDTGSKVVKMEAGTNDSGQMASQTQTSQKAFEMATAAKETEAGQSALRNQTMEQIVRRAVIQVRDGQHEARIDLKPEFLGHVRMQVITENQQVTVKILTEFGFVKDMIENNIHQLKADLQQQGLNVDKVDVAVSRDADGNKHSQENADRAKNQQPETDNTGGDNTREENQKPREHAAQVVDGLLTVDYFA
ncbi:MAG: flagellar hook-length control protein FliK [Proteobacteria bacterium]|nr:flagellar hook-length control protein FliK [Pseudomonadota bacterium]